MKENLILPEPLRKLAANHFVLLQSENHRNKSDTVGLHISGYSDVMYLVGDIVKVCLLALGDTENRSHASVPEPACNISGVLSLVLDLLPYEEAGLLDLLREASFEAGQPEDEDWGFELASITLSPPACLLEE
jgi:hypothetical protein